MKQFFKFLFASCLGSSLALIVSFFVIIGIFGAMISSLSKDEDKVEVKDNSVLYIDFSKPVYDRQVTDIQSLISTDGIEMNFNIGLNRLLQAIHQAKKDKKIKAIYMDMTSFSTNGFASAQEIREALQDFKSSGKKIYAYADTYTQKAYYVASVADEVVVNPAGMVYLTGIGSEVMFLKDLIKKLDVDVELIRPQNNAFKSAGERYTMNHMSDSNKLQTKAYINSIWEVICEQMCASRGISAKQFNHITSNLQAVMPEDAVKHNIVDALGFKSDFKQTVSKAVALSIDKKAKKKVNFISYNKYKEILPSLYSSQSENIAIVYAYGDVSQGKGSDLSIGSQTICKAIEKAAANKSVKAIVFRVNSPGGDAIASELITNEIIKAKKVKPVIVSMGDYAASAGYEMSSNASYIVASPTTITGSIGVFGVLPNFSRTLKNKLGISFDTIKTHANSNPLTVTTPMTAQSKALMQTNVETFYKNFVIKVAQGRNKTPQYINTIARGRVWSAVQAKDLGLVDEFGGLTKAIEIAAKMVGVKNYGLVEYPKVQSIWQQVVSSQSEQMKTKLLLQELGQTYPLLQNIKSLSQIQGIQMRMDHVIDF